MSRLHEILATGQAPGFNLKTIDPQLPEKSVPRAFRQLEDKFSADKIARDCGHSVKKIKRVWNIVAALTLLLAGTAAGADLTRGYTFTDGARLTAAQLHTLVGSAVINTEFLTGKNILSAVDGSDYLLLYDASAGTYKRMTLATLLLDNTDLITTQPAVTVPVAADYFLLYDSTGTQLGKVSYATLITGNTNLIYLQPEITNLVAETKLLLLHGGTNNQINLSNLWLAFQYRATFTNLAEHTAPTNSDRLLVWDSLTGTNKQTTLIGLVTNLPAASAPEMTSSLMLSQTGEVKRITLTELNSVLATNLQTFTSSNFPMAGYTASTNAHNAAHGLGVTPKYVRGVIECTTAEQGYDIGDEVAAEALMYTAAGAEYPIYSSFANATNIGCTLRWYSGTGNAEIRNKTNGIGTAITKANWQLKLYARP